MTKAQKNDPWMLDPNEAKQVKDDNKSQDNGTICPKRTIYIGGQCRVCDKVRELFNTGNKSDRDVALQKMAKCNFYANVVLPSNPSKVLILELGKKAGNEILDKIEAGQWLDIGHPKKGVGRELEITKKKGDMGFNAYSAFPSLEKADYDVPKEALDSRYDLDNIIELLDTEEIFKISSINMDETLKFRMLPWDSSNGRKRFLQYLYRHWGTSQEEIDGDIPVSLPSIATDNDSEGTGTDASTDFPNAETNNEVTKEPCFGDDRFYDSEDIDCRECDFYKSCGKKVLKNAV